MICHWLPLFVENSVCLNNPFTVSIKILLGATYPNDVDRNSYLCVNHYTIPIPLQSHLLSHKQLMKLSVFLATTLANHSQWCQVVIGGNRKLTQSIMFFKARPAKNCNAATLLLFHQLRVHQGNRNKTWYGLKLALESPIGFVKQLGETYWDFCWIKSSFSNSFEYIYFFIVFLFW